MTVRVFLVPGFFGFTNLGDFAYFSHVHDVLGDELSTRGVDAEVTPLDTLPTRSIRSRAEHLLEHLRRASDPGDELHVVGHSTGGLDARFLVASQVALPGRDELIERVASVVTIASPHRGAPVAAFFTSLVGQRLLKLLSLSTVAAIRLGSVPLPVLLYLGGAVAQTGALSWAGGGVLDQLYRLVLADFSAERRDQIAGYFEEAYLDQTLLAQLSPETMDLVDALATPDEDVRCASVVTAAPAPTLRTQASYGLNPTWQAMYGLYRGLHLLSSRTPSQLIREPAPEVRARIEDGIGWAVDGRDNDGMVPVLSQVWGEVIHATRADHMDVMGHFHGPGLHPAHVDWLRTGSSFGPRQFRAMLGSVAEFIADET